MEKIQISKQHLLKALETVKPGLANKEIIEQSTSFAFLDGKVITYNDEISITHPVEGLKNLSCAVNADELYRFLSKVKGDDLILSTNTNEITLTSGRSKIGLILQQEIKLPIESIGGIGKWKDLPSDFLEAIAFTKMGCSGDYSIKGGILTCVHVNSKGILESSDDLRIIRWKLEQEMPVKTFLIPADSVENVVRIKPTKIAEGKGWIHFQSEEGSVISCRVLEKDSYVDISPYLDTEGILITFPKTTLDALDRAMVFSKREYLLDEEVEITIENRILRIESKSNKGWFREEINIRYNEEPISFLILPHLLRDILLKISTCTIGEDRLKFEGAHWVYVSALKEKVK